MERRLASRLINHSLGDAMNRPKHICSRIPRLAPLTVCLLTALGPGSSYALGSGQSTVATPSAQPGPIRPAATLSVTSCADDGSAGTLRSVIALAATGDTVDLTQLACSAITLVTGELEVPQADLTINGPGQNNLIIDGNYNGRVIRHYGAGALTVSNLTIAHGLVDSAVPVPYGLSGQAGLGGCIDSDNETDFDPGATPYASLSLINATVTACKAIDRGNAPGNHGGGIYAYGAVTVIDSTVSNNTVIAYPYTFPGGNGGGIFARIGPITVTGSTISGNRVELGTSPYTRLVQLSGGGIEAYGMGAVVSNSLITNNYAGCNTTIAACGTSVGGGIGLAESSLSLYGSIVSNNVVKGVVHAGGGAVFGDNGRHTFVNVTNSTISGNSALGPSGIGGGIVLFDISSVISGSTISNNTAVNNAGGIYVGLRGQLDVVNSTISGNSAGNSAGAILVAGYQGAYPNYYFPITVSNSTISANTSNGSQGGGGIVDNHFTAGESTFQSSIIAGNINSVVGAVYDADLASSQSGFTIAGSNNLIVAASGVTLPPDTLSVDPKLGPLQNNGGPTQTHALLAGSPAIDAGNNLASLIFDERGPNYARVSGASADIGAFEYQQSSAIPTLTAGFSPSSIAAGSGVSTLTITLGNGGNGSAATLSADLVNTLPTSVYIASPANAATTCLGGNVTAEAGSGVATLAAGAQIPAASSCTVTVSVVDNTQGNYTDIIPANAMQTNFGWNDESANADLTVTPPSDRIFADGFELP
jgi:hypothetical protein